MSRIALVVALIVGPVAVAVAQDGQGRRGEGRRRGREGRGPRLQRVIDRMNERLDFDEEQLMRIEEIVATHEERMQAARALWEEMRAAREAGDDERADELREQMRQERDAQGPRGSVMQSVFDEIEPLLREDQAGAFQEMRERMAERQRSGGRDRMRGMGGMGRMLRELPDATNMTEEQRSQFEELLRVRRDSMRERMRERRQQGGEGGGPDGVPPRGGRDRPGRPDFGAMRDELFEEVAEILDDDQQELLVEYWTPVEADVAGQEIPETDEFRVVLIAAKRLKDMTRGQKRLWRGVASEAMRLQQQLRRSDEAGQAALNADVKAKVVEILEQDQMERFERNLEQMKSRKERGKRSRPK